MGIEIVLSGSHVCREYHSRCSVCASSGEARERVIERRVKTATGDSCDKIWCGLLVCAVSRTGVGRQESRSTYVSHACFERVRACLGSSETQVLWESDGNR